MGSVAFPDLGKHCSVESCKLIDFLPFQCDKCDKVFCLEHRTYQNHQCANANTGDVAVLVCPMCAKSVRLVPNEDPNITWERHVQDGCDPSNYERLTQKKAKCPVPGCKEVMTFSNKVTCKECHVEVCLKHRFGPDHNCRPGSSGSSSHGKGLSSLGEKFLKGLSTRLSSGMPSLSGAMAAVPAKASAEYASPVPGKSGLKLPSGLFTHPPASAGGSEVCPQCSTTFGSVEALIEHVESTHPVAAPRAGGGAQGGAGSGLPRVPVARPIDNVNVCPQCAQVFDDPVALVDHVETQHKNSAAGVRRSLEATAERCRVS
ncbi:hypothetical protein CBR_g37478 [Chara braunii]|uniref:AN1-type domain-containing protein n=1 Tax=Chara braunii TaxID=69332 RepID=A0A388LMX6_CHABU|nr:hypothetical protein CBR_g37478 [Chara braunii]|eukprot:GBG83677.1 hypothetical protein CBR_g37478 [Chara braunii]